MEIEQNRLEYPIDEPLLHRVLVKFREGLNIPYEDGVERYIQEYRLAPWSDLAEMVTGLTIERLFTTVTPEQIMGAVQLAQEMDEQYQPPDFLTFFTIYVMAEDDAQLVVRALSQWEIIEQVYLEPIPAPDPNQPVGLNPLLMDQIYLEAMPMGVDARFAWDFPGGQGEKQRFIDIERGWDFKHPELLNDRGHALVHLVGGINVAASQAHGTAVLGVILAQDNDIGGVGIAHLAKGRAFSTIKQAANGGQVYDVHNALIYAAATLRPGDVVLVEAQMYNPLNPQAHIANDLLPVEADPFCYQAILLAASKGITVIEVAGNGANDLDQWVDGQGELVLTEAVQDSAAIIVGSCVVVAGLNLNAFGRWPTSNYGSRVDCFAWGEQIATINGLALGATSGAAAIVAGVVLIIQGFCTANLNYRLKPKAMRRLLRQFGTLSNNPGQDKIGMMPDLRQIIAELQINGVPLVDQLPA
ncbi:MAG: hypothetical protein KJ063_05140 [Anaerolineae bacterium]|nr:hypothetical protein [Anaerolineae bacterium]